MGLLSWLALGCLAGSLASRWGIPGGASVCVCVCAIALAMCLRPGLARGPLLALLAGLALACARPAPPGAPDPHAPGGPAPDLLRVRVRTGYVRCAAQRCWSDGELLRVSGATRGSVATGRVRVHAGDSLPAFSVVEGAGRLQARAVLRNPGGPTAGQGTPRHALRLLEGHRTLVPAAWPLAWLGSARSALRRAADERLGGSAGGLARALLLGEAAALDSERLGAVRRAGVAHLLAVSGLHVGLLAGGLVGLLGLLYRRSPLALHLPTPRALALFGVGAAPVVAALCGAGPGAIRAAATASLGWLARACGRRPDPWRVGSGAVVLVAVLDPAMLAGPGAWLSIAATAALLDFEHPGLFPARRPARDLWRASLRTAVATAPLTWVCFGQICWTGPIANLLAIPVATALVLPCCVLFALCEALGMGDLAATPTRACSDALVALCEVLAPPAAWVRLPPPDDLQLVAASLAAAAWLWLRGRRRMLGVALALAIVGGRELQLRQPPEELWVHMLDVGQGDAAWIRTPGGHHILIDSGGNPAPGPDPGERAVLPALATARVRELALAVISHPHPDHHGGLRAVAAALPIAELWDSGQASIENPNGPWARQLRRLRARGTTVRDPATLCGSPRTIDGVRLQVLSPCPGFDPGYGENDNSLVVRVRYGERRWLFVGDIERDVERLLVERGVDLRADVLKVGHHGSRTSSTPEFLRAVGATVAVVSAGSGNRFGHPHAETLNALQAHGMRILRTDQHGAITLRSDGRSLHVTD